MTINTQRIAAIGRQFLAIAGIVLGVLTQSVTAMHLPLAVSTAITIAGATILAIEHYVGDPSTGNPVPPPSSPAMPKKAA